MKAILCLLAGLGLLLAGRAPAQTFTVLHSFIETGGDGGLPGGLTLSGNTLYGTAGIGGTNQNGMLFAINTGNLSYSNLYSFSYSVAGLNLGDGQDSAPALVISGNTLYGTTADGGSFDDGAVFAINTDGTGYTNVYSFNGGNIYEPLFLMLSGNTLYGTTEDGHGGLFSVNTNGTDYTPLFAFDSADGTLPNNIMFLGNTLYGTANGGGPTEGTLFAFNPNNGDFTNVYSFTGLDAGGINPSGNLVSSGNTLYGVTASGGDFNCGTIFSMNIDGTGYTNLHSFSAAFSNSIEGSICNADGAGPYAGLTLAGNTLYGTTAQGGPNGYGTIFVISTNGSAFTNLYRFTALGQGSVTNSDGALPESPLILLGNTLYGTALRAGAYGYGTVFALTLPGPQLVLTRAQTNVVLAWPTNAAGYELRYTTNASPPWIWKTNLTTPGLVNGQNAVTNPIAAAGQLFQLVHP